MKRLLMLLTTFCLLLMTTALAETEAEWKIGRASCRERV